MSEPRHLDLVDRLRGDYHLPVNDGAGPLNGSMTFSRKFETPPIQREAADELARLRALNVEMLAALKEAVRYLGYLAGETQLGFIGGGMPADALAQTRAAIAKAEGRL